MIAFENLLDMAAAGCGHDRLESLLPSPASGDELCALDDARYLSAMSRCVFLAGFVPAVVDAKWSGIEQRLGRFDPAHVANLSDPAMEALLLDPAIIRHRPKLFAVRDNARFMRSVAADHGSFGHRLANWPDNDLFELWQWLKTKGSRLGGSTGQSFLQAVGKDTVVLSPEVVATLRLVGIVDGSPTTQRAQRKALAAVGQWRQESGRPLCQIGRVLALAAGAARTVST